MLLLLLQLIDNSCVLCRSSVWILLSFSDVNAREIC